VNSRQGLSMFLFPRDPIFRKIWTTNMIKLKRYGFVLSQYKSTKICEHFEKDQFTIHPGLASFVGYKTKCKLLIPGTIPTVFNIPHPKKKAGVTERSDSRRKLTPGSFFYIEM
jgi:hypothetical protein